MHKTAGGRVDWQVPPRVASYWLCVGIAKTGTAGALPALNFTMAFQRDTGNITRTKSIFHALSAINLPSIVKVTSSLDVTSMPVAHSS